MRGGGRLDLLPAPENQKICCSVKQPLLFVVNSDEDVFYMKIYLQKNFYTCDKPAMLVSAKLVLPISACKMAFRAF
jgi:hypothetical protein